MSRRSLKALPLLLLILVGLGGCRGTTSTVPHHVYLVLTETPSTSITVQFHTGAPTDSVVLYDTVPPGEQASYQYRAEGKAVQIPGLPDHRFIHAVSLTGLKPGTRYYFETPLGYAGSFRTMSGGNAPVRVCFGGDIGTSEHTRTILEKAAAFQPDVAVLGGDISYAGGDISKVGIWDSWLRMWQDTMVREDGTLIPLVAAIGNHEVYDSHEDDPRVYAPFYTALFEQGGEAHFVRELAPFARLIVLDSGYVCSASEQAPFLRDTLASAEQYPYVLASYHVALFPTHYGFCENLSTAGRKHWMPLFDEFELSVAFEHHNHLFKRSKPIRNGNADPSGTIYLGDGNMGKDGHPLENSGAWYLEKAAPRSHFWLADITPDEMRCRAIDDSGEVFDAVTIQPRERRNELAQ